MTTTTTTVSLETYLKVLRLSGLVKDDVLEQAYQGFQQQHPDHAEDPQAFAEFLQSQQLVTAWQNEKLLQGKHRGFFLGKYKLLRHIGSGGMSRVFLAEHVRLKRRVAIKTLPSQRGNDPSYRDRFLLEARAIASLDHPNIVRAYDVSNQDTTYYMVIEYVDGQDLEKRVREHGPLDPLEAANYIRQVSDGLAHAHGRGMIHRDIKPGNLLLDQNGVVRVLDMGLARLTTLEHSLTIEHNETVLGTADYLAPEQAINSHEVDHRADIYSLGCSLYYLLAGHVPFPTGTLAQRLMKHQVEEPEPLHAKRDDVPPELIAIWKRMVAKKPEDRFQSAAELSLALVEFLESQGVAVPRPSRSDGSAIRERPSTMNLRLDETHIDPQDEDASASATQTLGDEDTEVLEETAEEAEETPEGRVRYASARWAAIGLGGLVSLGILVACLWMSGMDFSATPSDPAEPTVPLNQYVEATDLSFGNRKLLDFIIPENGEYRLKLDLKTALPGKAVFVEIDGQESQASDGLIPLRKADEMELGTIRLSKGRHQLAVVVTDELVVPGRWYQYSVWRGIGSFPCEDKTSSFSKSYPPEKELKFDKTYKGKWNKDIRWRPHHFTDGKVHSLKGRFHPGDKSICYLHRKITANRDGKLKIYFGHDDGAMVWCNGKEVYKKFAMQAAKPDDVSFELPLKKGENDLLIKICQGHGDWAFYFADKKGQNRESAPDLQYALRIEHQPANAD